MEEGDVKHLRYDTLKSKQQGGDPYIIAQRGIAALYML